MLNRISICTVLCMAVSTGLYAVNSYGADETSGNPSGQSPSRQTEANISLPQGIQSKNLNENKDIENAFKNSAQAAVKKSNFDNLVDNLVDQDRVRLTKSVPGGRNLNNIDGNKNQSLDNLIGTIDSQWKAKYNTGFDMDTAKVFTNDFISIQTGEITDPKQLIGKWPVQASSKAGSSSGAMGTPGTPGGASGTITQQDVNQATNNAFGGDVNLDKGRNVAIAHLTKTQNFEPLTASMIHEAGGWKFDVPNNLSAEELYNNLVKNLSYFEQHKDQWPADSTTACRELTHVVVASLYNVPLGEGNNPGAQPSGINPSR